MGVFFNAVCLLVIISKYVYIALHPYSTTLHNLCRMKFPKFAVRAPPYVCKAHNYSSCHPLYAVYGADDGSESPSRYSGNGWWKLWKCRSWISTEAIFCFLTNCKIRLEHHRSTEDWKNRKTSTKTHSKNRASSCSESLQDSYLYKYHTPVR